MEYLKQNKKKINWQVLPLAPGKGRWEGRWEGRGRGRREEEEKGGEGEMHGEKRERREEREKRGVPDAAVTWTTS